MQTISERLRTKTAMIHMGEKIAFGSETALMDEAADTIDALVAALVQARGCEVDPQTARQIDAALALARGEK